MAVENLVGTGFRIASVFIGIAIAYMVFIIYNRTRGGSDGWVALTLTYTSLGFWALLQVFYLWIAPNYGMRVVSGAILFFVIGVSNPLTSVLLAKDMNIKRPKWFNKRNYIIFVTLFFSVAIAYNFFLTPYTNPFAELLSIALLSVGVLFFAATYGFYILYKGTKLKFWYYMGIATLFVSIGVFLVVGFSNCCGLQGSLEGTESCMGWFYDYANVVPLPCLEGILPLLAKGTILILIGELISFYALFRIMRAMK